jgi:DNA-binding NarL/FixJ family response regulator
MTSVLVVDDHPVFRQGLRTLLEAHGIVVVGEADSVPVALDLLSRSPDVVLMDIGLPGTDGLTGTAQVLRARPDTRVLVVSMYRDDAVVAQALEAGAAGYLSKDTPPAELLRGILAVAEGSVILGASVAAAVRNLAAGGGMRAHTPAPGLFPELSERERQVLGLVADGLDNSQIAQRLGLSTKTVANYVSTVLTRLSARDRTALRELVARRRGG